MKDLVQNLIFRYKTVIFSYKFKTKWILKPFI